MLLQEECLQGNEQITLDYDVFYRPHRRAASERCYIANNLRIKMKFFDVVNLYGLLFVIIMAVPHIVYRRTHSYNLREIPNKGMLYVARAGKYSSAFLMVVNIGVLEEGFTSPLMRDFWLISTCVMVTAYIILWIILFMTESKKMRYAITALAAVIIILSGLLQVKTLLLTAGIVYLIGEMYVAKNITSV